jgi:PKD domain-containing protein
MEMFIHQRRLIRLLLPIALAGLSPFSSEAFAQKGLTETVIYTPPTLEVLAEPNVVTTRRGDLTVSSKVQLHAKVASASSKTLRYKWSASGGRIDGNGADVFWDLSGVQPGYHKAFVEVDTGSANDGCIAFSSTTVMVNFTPLVCPSIQISCPDKVVIDQALMFSATITGGSDNAKPGYNWTVSAGRIIEGAGTNSIKVDTGGVAGQTITATLSMGGYGLDCATSCSIQIPLPKVPSRKFDKFPNIARNDEKARLDNLAIELQGDPSATAYVIIYPARRGRPGEVEEHTKHIIDYLVNSRGIGARRIVSLVGPPHDELMVELWITPQGAIPPTPTP